MKTTVSQFLPGNKNILQFEYFFDQTVSILQIINHSIFAESDIVVGTITYQFGGMGTTHSENMEAILRLKNIWSYLSVLLLNFVNPSFQSDVCFPGPHWMPSLKSRKPVDA